MKVPFEATKTGWIGNKNRMKIAFRQQKQDDRQQKQDEVPLFHLQKNSKKMDRQQKQDENSF